MPEIYDQPKIFKQPVELILLQMSGLKYKAIKTLCESNKKINEICKKNKDVIARYTLKNDYDFTNFPDGLDYISIVENLYMRSRSSPYKSIYTTNLEKRNKWKRDWIESAATYYDSKERKDRLDVVKFLFANGINKKLESVLESAVENAVESGDLELVKFLVKNGANISEKLVKKINKLGEQYGKFTGNNYSQKVKDFLINYYRRT